MQLRVEEFVRPTLVAFEAFRAFPLALWNQLQLWCPAEGVKSFVAHITVQEVSLLCGRGADIAELAIKALPIGLKLGNQSLILFLCEHDWGRFVIVTSGWKQLKTVCVEALSTKGAR